MIIDLETGANEGNKTIEKISAFRKESFFKCKTYLYTVFMRISEMLEMSRQKAWSLNLLECQREI